MLKRVQLERKYELTFLHKLAVVVLIGTALLLLCDPFIYRKQLESNLSDTCFSFLQAGDYVLEIGFKGSPAENEIIVWSDLLTGPDNQLGMELARQAIDEGAGIIRIAFHLDQATHDVRVGTTLDDQPGHYFFSVVLQRVQLLARDRLFLSALCIFTAISLFLLGCFVPKETYLKPMLLIVLGLLASFPLFSDTLTGADDIYYHLSRIEGLYQGIKAGEFPVRINCFQNSSFGNLSATMYPQLFLYLAAMLRLAGISLMLSYKLLVTAVNIGTAFASFYSVKSICKSAKIGGIAAILYTFSIYRLTNLYFRAALGEVLAMLFLPLALWGIYEVLWGNRNRWYLLMLGVTGILQSHMISMEMSLFFLVLESVWWLIAGKQKWKEKLVRIASGFMAAVGTCLLNASFLLPFLFFSGEDLQVFRMESGLADSVVYFSQMFALFPNVSGIDLPVGTTTGEMPLTIGAVLAAGSVLFCISVAQKEKEPQAVVLGKHCLYYGIVCIVMASWLFPWRVFNRNPLFLQVTTPLQFAWRLFGPASLFLSVTSAVGIAMFVSEAKGRRNWVYGVIAAMLLCSTIYFFDTTVYQKSSTNNKMELEGNSHSDSNYMYSDGGTFKAFHLNYSLANSYIKTLNGTKLTYSNYSKAATQISVDIELTGSVNGQEYLLFPLYYFPGYEVLVNGEKVLTEEKDTLVACRLPEEDSHIEVSYQGLWFFKVGDIVSLLTALGLAGFAAVKYRMAKKE